MISIRLAFLLLILMGLNIYAQNQPRQTEQNNKPQAYKFDEYGKITNKDLKPRLEKFVRFAIDNDADSGVIILYAPTDKILNLRVAMILKNWERNLCHWDCIRFTFVNANHTWKERTEFWVVPKGAEQPEPKSEAYKFGMITGLKYSDCRKVGEFRNERIGSNHRRFIVLYGANFDKITGNLLKKCSNELRGTFEGPMFTFINAGFRKKQSIELWIVPEGEEPPIFKDQEK